MKRWSWLMAIVLCVSMLGFVGCDDDDGDDDDAATTTEGTTAGGTAAGGDSDDDAETEETASGGTTASGTTTSGTTASGTTTGETSSGGTSSGGTTTATPQTLVSSSGLLAAGNDWSSDGWVAPADGFITLNVTWSSMLDGSGTPAPSEYSLYINLGGVVINGSASSPAQLRAGAPAGSSWKFTFDNRNAEGMVNITYSLVWSSN